MFARAVSLGRQLESKGAQSWRGRQALPAWSFGRGEGACVCEGGMVGIDRSIECARACEAKRKRGAKGDDWRWMSVSRKSWTPRARAFILHLGLLGAARTDALKEACCVREEWGGRGEGARRGRTREARPCARPHAPAASAAEARGGIFPLRFSSSLFLSFSVEGDGDAKGRKALDVIHVRFVFVFLSFSPSLSFLNNGGGKRAPQQTRGGGPCRR